MDLTMTLPSVIYVIWGTVLAIVVFVIVPLAIGLLQRTLNAALSIRRYFAEMLAAGVGIAENTASVSALNDTIAVAVDMINTAGQLKEHSGTIAQVLSQRAAAETDQ